jgi:hypothetical protein
VPPGLGRRGAPAPGHRPQGRPGALSCRDPPVPTPAAPSRPCGRADGARGPLPGGRPVAGPRRRPGRRSGVTAVAHGGLGPSLELAAATARPTDSSASASGEPAGPGGGALRPDC